MNDSNIFLGGGGLLVKLCVSDQDQNSVIHNMQWRISFPRASVSRFKNESFSSKKDEACSCSVMSASHELVSHKHPWGPIGLGTMPCSVL